MKIELLMNNFTKMNMPWSVKHNDMPEKLRYISLSNRSVGLCLMIYMKRALARNLDKVYETIIYPELELQYLIKCLTVCTQCKSN